MEGEDVNVDEIMNSVNRENIPFTQTDDEIAPIIVSRMNPFTPGHVILLTEALLYAVENNLHQVSIILSQSWDDDKNPVDPHTKQRMIYDVIPNLKRFLMHKYDKLAEAIDGIQVVIELMGNPEQLFVDEDAAQEEETSPKAAQKEDVAQLKASRSPALTTLYRILENYYKYPRKNLKVVVFCGEDRNYDFIRDSLSKFSPPVLYEEIKLRRPDMQRLIDMSPEDLTDLLEKGIVSKESISASVVRKTAKSGKQEVFIRLMDGTFLSPEDIREVYETILDVPLKALIKGPSNPKKSKDRRGGTLKKKYKKNIKKTRKHKRKHTKRNKK